MKTRLLFVFLSLILVSNLFAQFDKPVLQVGIGLVEPFGDLKGTYYRNVWANNFLMIAPDTNFMTNNYGAKTGLHFFGKGKINFDKYSITRAAAFISFSTFNTFEQVKNGTIGVRVNINGQWDTIASSASYNYTFNDFSFGFGLEISPLSFTNVFSPYFGANMSFNSFSGKLSRTENHIDTTTVSFQDFRIGFNFDAGIEAKFNKNIGMVLGVKFDLGNVLLKNTSGGIADRIEWGKSNASLNDDEGTFFSSIYSPVISSDTYLLNSKKKDINWGTLYLGVNIYFDTGKTTKKKTGK